MKQASVLLAVFATISLRTLADTPPAEWIDPSAGHRIVCLSAEPGSESLYFNENAWTSDGDKLVITSPRGILDYNFKTHQTELVVSGTNIFGVIVSPKSRQVYYVRRNGHELT